MSTWHSSTREIRFSNIHWGNIVRTKSYIFSISRRETGHRHLAVKIGLNNLTIRASENEKRNDKIYFTERLVNQRTDPKRKTDMHIRFGNAFYGKLKAFINNSLLTENLSGSKARLFGSFCQFVLLTPISSLQVKNCR